MAGKSAGKLTWKWIVDVQFATTASGVSRGLLPEFTFVQTQKEVWSYFRLFFLWNGAPLAPVAVALATWAKTWLENVNCLH